MPRKAVTAPRNAIVAIPDAFGGTEEIKLRAPDGHRLMRIEAEVGVINNELIDLLKDWLDRRPA